MLKIRIKFILFLLLLPAALSSSQQKDGSRQEVAGDHWKKWLEEDVVYIITEEEADVFKNLATEEEREQFVEQFWQRRDTDPRTPQNEFREEHFRRIQYANDRYAAGIPGWKTDRGRVYIMYGAPHRVESHPIGGPYARPEHEGGGHTSTFPFEIWNYRYIEGLGSDVEIEFVDLSGAGLYKITANPWDKDEFLHVPGMGNTWAEDAAADARDDEQYASLRGARVSGFRKYGDGTSQGIMFEREKYKPFARTELVAKLTAPPIIKFTDLRSAVSAKVTFNTIPFRAQASFLRMTNDYTLAPLAMEFPNSSIRFEHQYGLYHSRLQVYGVVTDLVGRVIYEFDDEIVNQYNEEVFAGEKDGVSRYFRSLALEPGRYKIQLVVKDDLSGQMGTLEFGLLPPSYNGDKLSSSSVIFTSKLSGAPAERALRDPYVFGRFKVRPRFDRSFHSKENLGIYFELYNFDLDPSTQKPAVQVEYAVCPKSQPAEPKFLNISRAVSFDSDHIAVPFYVDVSGLEPGDYEIRFRIRDQISGRSMMIREPFSLASD